MISTLRKAFNETVEELSAEHANLKAVWDDMAQFMAEYKKWESLGMIRRDETMFD
jgi:TRAP-type mannitol/chloroaromatic compound transport system substrate-binding protein